MVEAGSISLRPDEVASYTGNAPVVVVPYNTSPSQAVDIGIGTVSGGGGGGSGSGPEKVRAAQEAERQRLEGIRQIEAMRQAGIAKIAADAKKAAQEAELQQKRQASSQELTTTLRIRQQITKAAADRGESYSAREIRKELERRGTSIEKLRQATKAAQEHYKKTGENVFEQVAKEIKDIDVKAQAEVRIGGDYNGSNVYFEQQQLDRTGQVYDSRTNMYVSSAYGVTGGGTAIMSPLTLEEQRKIDLANIPISERVEIFETKLFGEKIYGGTTKLDKY